MKKIDLTVKIVDLDGKPVMMSPQDMTELTVGKTLALILQSYKGARFDPLKLLDMALTCYKQSEIELDGSDIAGLQEIIKQNMAQPTGFSGIILGQLLKILLRTEE